MKKGGESTIDGIKILLRLIVKSLRFLLEFLESPLGVHVDSIFGVFADVEFGLELLGGSNDALLEAF